MYSKKWFKKKRFRTFRVLLQYLKDKAFGIRYLIYNILSKYNIIYKRYYYIDNVVEGSEVLEDFGAVETKRYLVTLNVSYTSIYHVREEYFYKDTKYGRKTVLPVSDSHYYTTDFNFYPNTIRISFSEGKPKWHEATSIKVFEEVVPIHPIKAKNTLEKPVYHKTLVDVTPIRLLRYGYHSTLGKDDLSLDYLKYLRNIAIEEFSKVLSTLPLSKIIVKKGE